MCVEGGFFFSKSINVTSRLLALLRHTRLLISEKSATYTIKWSYMIIWQVRVHLQHT